MKDTCGASFDILTFGRYCSPHSERKSRGEKEKIHKCVRNTMILSCCNQSVAVVVLAVVVECYVVGSGAASKTNKIKIYNFPPQE